MKYVGVHIDKKIQIQDEVKHFLKQMACGTKTIYTFCYRIPKFLTKTVLKEIFISNLHHNW